MMQDALVNATNKKSNKRKKGTLEFYDYEIFSAVSFQDAM